MKRPLPFLAVSLALLLSAAIAFAQQPQRINYSITNYFNVPADKVGAMLDEARTSGRKLMQDRIASGENITRWVVLRTAFRGVTPAINYNYAISVTFDGAPQTPNVAARDQLYRKLWRMAEVNGVMKLHDTRYRNMLVQPQVVGYKKHPILVAEFMYYDLDNTRRRR